MTLDNGRHETTTRVAFIMMFAAIFAFFSSRGISNGTNKSIPQTVGVVGPSRSPWCDETARDLYIDLLKRAVSNFLYQCHPPELNCVSMLREPIPFSKAGSAGQVDAKSMVGTNGLDQVEGAIRTILAEDVPGDLVETGVFKGGTCIFMLGMLKAMGDTGRVVHVADSFRGIPPVNLDEYSADKPHRGTDKYLPKDISVEVVMENFFQFGLLDHTRLRFLKGWFNETLPAASFDSKIALLRMDGDLFESTWDALSNVYDKVSIGGYVIVDDYGDWIGCQKAVDWYREFCGEEAPISRFDSVWPNQVGKFAHWRKSRECPLGVGELNRLRRERQKNGGK